MDIEQLRELCLSIHAQVEECSPFADLGSPDDCFKIAGKIFAYICLDGRDVVVFKCDPERALMLREEYPDIIEPAWHWNKKYWNQVHFSRLSDEMVRGLLTHSFEQVTAKLSRRLRTELGLLS